MYCGIILLNKDPLKPQTIIVAVRPNCYNTLSFVGAPLPILPMKVKLSLEKQKHKGNKKRNEKEPSKGRGPEFLRNHEKIKNYTIVSPLPPPLASREPCQRPLSSAKPGRLMSSRITSFDGV
jgi:hypothetical protein